MANFLYIPFISSNFLQNYTRFQSIFSFFFKILFQKFLKMFPIFVNVSQAFYIISLKYVLGLPKNFRFSKISLKFCSNFFKIFLELSQTPCRI